MKIVIVESPAKAKTINKYLGDDYTVMASFGHIRDLPSKDGSVIPDQDFTMLWEMEGAAEKRMKEIVKAVKGSDALYLATDPDREGEAISWHVNEVLQEKKALKGVTVKRVVFNEITKTAVTNAMKSPREIDQQLVDAYLARRALDYLVGFTLSPVLWRKLPGSRSAGRVQSVALRLICERESEIESFKPQEYWKIEGDFQVKNGLVTAGLTHLKGKKLDKFALPNQEEAEKALKTVQASEFEVWAVEKKKVKRHPFAPFTTSTLQQEASRKLGFSASKTMQIAQKLYEGIDLGGETVGLITYMRTDGVQMAQEAIGACRSLIGRQFGAQYLPAEARIYKAKAKNAQEAHEAIRPTDVFRKPDEVGRYLDRDQLRLYELIWKRAVASQMESAVLDQVAVDFADPPRHTILRATGSVVAFDGFLKLYREDHDDLPDDGGEEGKILPPIKEGEGAKLKEARKSQHFTQAPPRYTEASLVKRLEELGIGRPSTYASIISVLQDRNYVKLDQKRFIPEDRGRIVTTFLETFFNRYVQYNFTADLENQLDHISDGKAIWKDVLKDFWAAFIKAVEETKDLRTSQVIDTLDEILAPHFFPNKQDGSDPRVCPLCHKGKQGLRLGKFGAFIGCSGYPDCKFTRPLALSHEGDAPPVEEDKCLGVDNASGQEVLLRKGPYGFYVQLGEAKGKEKPKRATLLKNMSPGELKLETALKLLALPRKIGLHPETKEEIIAGVGRFGPYLKHGSAFKSIPAGDDVLEIGINRAVDILAAEKKTRSGGEGSAKSKGVVLGEHPEGGEVILHPEGRYGAYVSWNKLNATLPKGVEPANLSLEEAIALVNKKKDAPPAKRPIFKGKKKA